MGLILKPRVGLRPRWNNNPMAIPQPMGAWMMNEGGGTFIKDSSGNSQDMVNDGADWLGGNLQFVTDNSDWLKANITPIVPTVFTVFAICTNSISGVNEHTLLSAWDGTNRIHLGLQPNDGEGLQDYIWACHSNASYERYVINGFQDGNFHSHGLVWDGTIYEYYFDQTLIGVDAAGDPSNTDQSVLLIGARATGVDYDRFFNGIIKIVYLYKHALTAAQIAYIHQNPCYAWEYPELWELYAAAAAPPTDILKQTYYYEMLRAA